MKRKVFSILALLLMAVVDATAQTTYSVTVKDGTVDADKWTATPNPATAGQTVTVKYTGTKKVKSVKVVKKAAAPAAATLAETLTTAGMTVKVKYNYHNEENYCTFVSNGGGTYTFQSGDGFAGDDDDRAKDLVVEDDKLVFKQNFFDTIDDLWNQYGFSVTFDTSNNTYIQWIGEKAQEFHNPSFISVEVNGTEISLTKILTVADLIKENGDSWETIVANNS